MAKNSTLDWITDHRSERGVNVREFVVQHSGRSVPGALWSPENPVPGSPMVVLGHGASGDRFQVSIAAIARRMARHHGCFGLSIDGPVHGRRAKGDGARTEFRREWARPGTVQDMTADWKATIDAVQSLEEVGRGSLGYWGLSMGTIYGAPLVSAEPRITVAVLGLMGLVGPSEEYKQEIRRAADGITCPVLFINQLDDELFARDRCQALFDRIASKDKSMHANPGSHAAVPVAEFDHSEAFLAKHLL